MKHIVEYKLHGTEIPYFIKDGGYFPNEGKLIGVTYDDARCHVPPADQLTTFASKEDFAAYIVALNIDSAQNIPLTFEQKTALANAFWDSKQ